ncbi:hypothetical protein [Mycobacterium sp. MUNTM1]
MSVTAIIVSGSIEFLPDYCPHCNPFGHHADSRIRLASLTDPTSVTWPGGKRVICDYYCDDCGHEWRRADLWTAKEAGFDPKERRAGRPCWPHPSPR